MGAGLCGLDSVGPDGALLKYDTYVIPTMLYRLEALVLDTKDINKNLRCIQHLPQATAIPADNNLNEFGM